MDIFDKELMIETDPHHGTYESISVEKLYQIFEARRNSEIENGVLLVGGGCQWTKKV